MNTELEAKLPGITWNFSQNIRDNVMEALSGIKGDNSVKIIGPTWTDWRRWPTKTKNSLQQVRGIENVGIFHIRGQSHLEFRVDPEKCQRWGVQTADVNNVVHERPGGTGSLAAWSREKSCSTFPFAGPRQLRSSESDILDIPVDIGNNTVVQSHGPGRDPQRDRHRASDVRPTSGPHGQHGQPSATRPACGCAIWSRRSARTDAPDPDGQFSGTGRRRSIANKENG